jgi:hypothetical protein
VLKRFHYKKLDDQKLDDQKLDDTRSRQVSALEHRSNRDDLKIRPLTDHPDLRRALGLDRPDHRVAGTPDDLSGELADRFDLRRLLESKAA